MLIHVCTMPPHESVQTCVGYCGVLPSWASGPGSVGVGSACMQCPLLVFVQFAGVEAFRDALYDGLLPEKLLAFTSP
jgi:hypothetical protein